MTETPRTTVGLGVNAGLDPQIARRLAERCVELGYHSLWSNDEASESGLETLAQFAAATGGIGLGVGVLPLDRWPPRRIAEELDRLGLDPARLWLGIGSGRLHPQVERVRDAVGELRELLDPATRIVVAAMRRRLCRLGGSNADGVLCNWMLPANAATAREWVQEGAASSTRAVEPITALYVRVAVGPHAPDRLRDDEGRYRTIDDGHRRHFAAMDIPLGTVGIADPDGTMVRHALAGYSAAVDLPIVRVLAGPHLDDFLAVAEAAAPSPVL